MATVYGSNAVGPVELSPKDPNAIVDYTFDWSDYLGAGETISSYTITVSGVTLSDDSNTGETVTAWVSAGTAGTVATIACRIVTSDDRTDERTIAIKIRSR